jgi:hypothetical protein
MKLIYSLLVLSCLGSALFGQKQIRYAVSGGTGDGSSWINGADLNNLLQSTTQPLEIWVQSGKYTATKGIDREISFEIPDGFELYGGFSGTETERSQRDWRANKTILSGEIGEEGFQDNTYNVIRTENVSNTTVVDGFVIRDGFAGEEDTTGPGNACKHAGAGWFNKASNEGESSPVVRNCIFRNNNGSNGAAFYNNARLGGQSDITFQKCKFIQNAAFLMGGAILIETDGLGKVNAKFDGCTWKENYSNYGGSFYVEVGDGKCDILLKACKLNDNTAGLYGGVIMETNEEEQRGDFQLIARDSIFENNYPTDINRTHVIDGTFQELLHFPRR